MKKILFILVCCLFAVQLYALSATTRGTYASCSKKEWLQDMLKFANAKDFDSFQAYLTTEKCLILQSGLKVTVTDHGVFSGVSCFVFKGFKLWTVTEELENMTVD